MADKKPLFPSINLLIRQDNKTQFYITLIKWLTSSGRFIVILVEFIVIIAFVARYKLDSDLANLHDKIQNQLPYIKSLQPAESQIRHIQFQLTTIKQIKDGDRDFSAVFSIIASLTPATIQITNITLDRTGSYPNTQITISGNTPSNVELSAFINALKGNKTFTNVVLTNITLQGQSKFVITADLNQQGGQT